MPEFYRTDEPLEDQQPIPEDATDAEADAIRAENEQIRQRNRQRLAAKTEIGTAIGRKAEFLSAGSDALSARDAMAANENIPQEVVDFSDGVLQMLYLIYIHEAGEGARIDSFEDKFF